MPEHKCIKCGKRVISISFERLKEETIWERCNDGATHVWGDYDWKRQLIWK